MPNGTVTFDSDELIVVAVALRILKERYVDKHNTPILVMDRTESITSARDKIANAINTTSERWWYLASSERGAL